MKTLLRFMGILLGTLVVAIAGVALILPHVFDPNDYRDRIAAWVKDKTGRELVMAGTIGWSVFPWLGVELGEVRLANAAGFGDAPFAQIAAVQARVKLLPLLRKDVEMSTVLLDGVRINLAKAPDGRTNWADLLPPATGAKTGVAPDKKPAGTETSAAPLAALAIGGVRIRDARLVWDDRMAGTQYSIEHLNLQTGAIRPDRPIDVTLDFVAKRAAPAFESMVSLSGQVTPTQAFKRIAVRDLTVAVAARGQGLPGGKLEVKLNAQLAYAADQTTPARVQLSQLSAQSGDSTVTGTFGVRDFARPVYTFKLAVDNFDLDRYLPPREPETATAAPAVAEPAAQMPAQEIPVQRAPAQPQAQRKATAGLFPVQTLRGLNLNGSLNIGSLTAYQLRSSDVDITVSAKDGLLHVFPARANLYQGTYNGNITVDVRGEQPRIVLDEQVSGVQAEPLLTDLLGKAKVTGTAEVTLKLTATGNHPPAIRETLNGNARFAFTDGVVKGLDVLGEIRKAYALLRGKPQAAGVSGQTEFSAVTGTATVTNGRVNNPDLVGQSPLMHVQGRGTANLVTQQLDYNVVATLVDSLEGQGELTGRPIPVRITGAFGAPKVGVDLEKVLRREVEKQLEKKFLDKLKDGGLKGLFGR